MPEIDWFEQELSITKSQEWCPRCGEGDSDWCESCNGCRYSSCDTCTCDNAYCDSCGEGDSDWCYDCQGCRYRNCDTCTCEHEYELVVTYRVTVAARSEDDIDSDDVHEACRYSSPDDWEVE